MPNYLRAQEGNTYFFTVVTFKRQRILCLDKSRQLLRAAIGKIRETHPFAIEAWVLLPDHLHCIWQLQENDLDYSKRWGFIKREFTKGTNGWLNTPCQNASRRKHREGTVWQRRFWEHMIRDDHDLKAHCDYIHYNPVKHGLVTAPKDWPYSTFHRYVRDGKYPLDWGADLQIQFENDIGRE